MDIFSQINNIKRSELISGINVYKSDAAISSGLAKVFNEKKIYIGEIESLRNVNIYIDNRDVVQGLDGIFNNLRALQKKGMRHYFTQINLQEFNGQYREDIEVYFKNRYGGFIFRILGVPDEKLQYPICIWIHITCKKPLAILIMSQSNSGKSSYSRFLMNHPNICVLNGDKLLAQMVTSSVSAPIEVREICKAGLAKNDWSYSISELISRNLITDFLNSYTEYFASEAIVFEMWVPKKHWNDFILYFKMKGYRVIITDTSFEVDESLNAQSNLLTEQSNQLTEQNNQLTEQNNLLTEKCKYLENTNYRLRRGKKKYRKASISMFLIFAAFIAVMQFDP